MIMTPCIDPTAPAAVLALSASAMACRRKTNCAYPADPLVLTSLPGRCVKLNDPRPFQTRMRLDMTG